MLICSVPERKADLSSQKMEVVSRSGAVGHNVIDVNQLLDGKLVIQLREVLRVITGHLKEPLRSGTAVLWSHSLHTMG